MEQLQTKENTTQISEKLLKIKKFNAKLFPIYKMFSWDLLFYYSVSFLFLTQVKGFTTSNVLILDAVYTISKFISQIPCINITELIRKKKRNNCRKYLRCT